MKKIIVIWTLFILLILSGCSSKSYDDGYSRCYIYTGGDTNLYVFPINFHTSSDQIWKKYETGSYNRTKSITYISEETDYFDTQNYEEPSISGKLFLGWEDENGNLINSSNPLIINYNICKSEPVKLYARFKVLSIFYDLKASNLINL